MEKVYCRQKGGEDSEVECRAGWAMHLNNVHNTLSVLLRAQERYSGEVHSRRATRAQDRPWSPGKIRCVSEVNTLSPDHPFGTIR